MSYNERKIKALIAEHAVRQYLKTDGWYIERSEVRNSLSGEHNRKLSLDKMSDIGSLYIRHFPDHVATRTITIFIQTKNAPTGYPLFNAEKKSIDNLAYLPEECTLLVFFIYDTAEFCAILFQKLKQYLPDCVVRTDGGVGGSGTPFYQIPRNLFEDLSIVLTKLDSDKNKPRAT